MIKAVIFDMDGIIIDSEHLWREAEISALSKTGLSLTDEMCRQTTGLRIDEMVSFWYNIKPWNRYSKKDIENYIEDGVCGLIKTRGEMIPGIDSIISFVNEQKITKALASSSSIRVIETVLGKLKLKSEFALYHSAENEEFGKPHPAVYISTASKLGVDSNNCLAIEDSINGLIAAKAAKMRTVAIPEKSAKHNKTFLIADIILERASDFSAKHWQWLNSVNSIKEGFN